MNVRIVVLSLDHNTLNGDQLVTAGHYFMYYGPTNT